MDQENVTISVMPRFDAFVDIRVSRVWNCPVQDHMSHEWAHCLSIRKSEVAELIEKLRAVESPIVAR